MSRAYRIQVSESVQRIVHVEDGVATTLDLLPIVGKERMRELVAAELGARGFVPSNASSSDDGAKLRRIEGSTVVEFDPMTGEVKVSVTREQEVELKTERSVGVSNPSEEAAAAARAKIRGELAREVDRRQEGLRREATTELEGKLRDLREELDRVVNRVTAEALKERARTLGVVEEIHEDARSGNVTIKVRV